MAHDLTALNALMKEAGIDVANRATGKKLDVIPTGYPALDNVLLNNIGGLPKGMVIEVIGNEGSFKTGFCLHMARQTLLLPENQDKFGIYIDAEGTYVEDRAIAAGIPVERFIVIQGNNAEKQFNDATNLIRTGKVCFFCLDSIGILIEADAKGGNLYKEEAGETDPEEAKKGKKGGKGAREYKSNRMPGRVAKLTTEFIQSITDDLREHGVLSMFINQLRDKIGVTFGDKTDTPGGRLLKFAKVVDLKLWVVKRLSSIPNAPSDGLAIGFELLKFKFGPSRVKTPDDAAPKFYFTEEARQRGDILSLIGRGVKTKVLEVNGSWYTMVNASGEELGKWQGQMQLIKALMEDKPTLTKLTNMVRSKEKIAPGSTEAPSAVVNEPEGEDVSDEQTD